MAILKKAIIAGMPLILSGCYENFTPDIKTSPVLCLNSLITAGEPVAVRVTHTWLYTDNPDAESIVVKDADVKVYVNDVLAADDYIAQEGDLIRIVADSPKYGHAEAEVTVPLAAAIESIQWEPVLNSASQDVDKIWIMNGSLNFNLKVKIEIADNQRSNNYFGFSYSGFYPDDDIIGNPDFWDDPDRSYCTFGCGNFKAETEPIFSEHIGVFEAAMGTDVSDFCYFTDRQFSGKLYTLHLTFADGSYFVRSQVWNPEMLECGYSLKINSISESYYNWVNYAWQNREGLFGDIGDIGLGDPIWGYSNVSTGAGVVAAQSTTIVTINLKEFLQQSLTDNDK